MLFVGLIAVLIPLIVTLGCELTVARMFRLKGRDLWPVIAANCLTNPALNVALLTLWGLGIGISKFDVRDPEQGPYAHHWVTTVAPWVYLAIGLSVMVIIAVEWGLLAWALRGRAGSSLRVFALSVSMNVVSGGLTMFMPFVTSTILLFAS